MSAKTHMIMIPLVTLAATGYYTYFGQMVPQKEVHPPANVEVSAELSTDEMVEVGQKIFEGKGTCTACHKLSGGSGRFPDLGMVGSTAGTRRPGMDDIDYLGEALYRPDVFIVEGFNPGMPQVNKAPIGLHDGEIKALIAYLQSLGGTPTMTMDRVLEWETGDMGGGDSGEAASAESSAPMPPQQILTNYLCNTCHALDKPGDLVGPSLFDIGARLSSSQLYESLMEPDATVAEGFSAGLMGATLEGTGFYTKVSSAELKALVAYLAAQKGK
jgi:cytochrome c2